MLSTSLLAFLLPISANHRSPPCSWKSARILTIFAFQCRLVPRFIQLAMAVNNGLSFQVALIFFFDHHVTCFAILQKKLSVGAN